MEPRFGGREGVGAGCCCCFWDGPKTFRPADAVEDEGSWDVVADLDAVVAMGSEEEFCISAINRRATGFGTWGRPGEDV